MNTKQGRILQARIMVLALTILALATILVRQDATHYPDSPVAPGEDHYIYLPLLVAPGYTVRVSNPGFEGDRWHAACWWMWPFHYKFCGTWSEIAPGEDWVAWWVEKRPCPNVPTVSGRPEVKVIDLDENFPDPFRIAEGRKALQWFTYWRCGYGGVYQQAVFPDGIYRFGAKVHTWYSSCSHAPHASVVLDKECQELEDEHMWIRLGVDVAGSADLYSGSLVWSEPSERYGTYGPGYTWSPWVEFQGGGLHTGTLWVRWESTWPLEHNDGYVDAVVIQRLEYPPWEGWDWRGEQ